MSERMIENRIKELQAIEAQQKDLETQAEAHPGGIEDHDGGKGLGRAPDKKFCCLLEENYQ